MENTLTFENLTWKEHGLGGLQGTLTCSNGILVSVLAGSGFYSTPRENILDPKAFSAFEVALLAPGGGFITEKVLGEEGAHDVIGWKTVSEINEIITKANNY